MQVSKHLHLKFTQKPKMMKKTVLMLFIGLLSLGVYAQETAKIEFKSETIDYGEIERGSDGVRVMGQAPCKFVFKTNGGCHAARSGLLGASLAPGWAAPARTCRY